MYVAIALLFLPVFVIFVNIILNGWIMVRTAAVFAIVISPLVFLVYRLAHADRFARGLVSLTLFAPLYVIYFYMRIFFAPVPDEPESLAWTATIGLVAPSEMLPLLIPAIGYLVGIILLWTPSALSWFANHESRNEQEEGEA